MTLLPPPDPVSKPRPPGRPRVLLAEDDAVSRRLLRTLLTRRGYDVEVVASGIALYERLLRQLDPHAPDRVDLVITDHTMPGMTGLQVVEALQARGRLPAVILVSSFAGESVRVRARQLGVRILLDKPFDLDELFEAVTAALETAP